MNVITNINFKTTFYAYMIPDSGYHDSWHLPLNSARKCKIKLPRRKLCMYVCMHAAQTVYNTVYATDDQFYPKCCLSNTHS